MASVLLLGADRDRALGLRALLREDGHVVHWHRRLADWRVRERERGEEPDRRDDQRGEERPPLQAGQIGSLAYRSLRVVRQRSPRWTRVW